MRKFLLLNAVLLLLCIAPAMAQTRAISGKLTSSEDGSVLPGVNILVKGSANGTVTDAEGRYSISASPSDVLFVSFIGFMTKEVVVGDLSVLDVALDPDVKQLSEIVVVGYGTADKRDLTGNIAHIAGSAIQGVPVTSLEQSIQGKAAGVFVEAENGKLGQGIKVRIRGSSSVSASNQPLYVIDGIPITTESNSTNGADTNPMADLNFNDVASVEILKDASASAIYGSRAANGVVLITTRRGKAGKTNFTVNYYGGVSQETHRRKFIDANQYVAMETLAAEATGYQTLNVTRLTRYAAGADYTTSKVNTDWQDQVFQKGATNQIDVTASGGNEKTRFFVSGQYSDQNGILIGNRFKKLTARMNLDHTASEKLSFGVNFNIARTENHRLSNDDDFGTPLQIVALSPITPVIDPRTGKLSGVDDGTGSPNSNFPVYYNPLISSANAKYIATVYRMFANGFATYNIAPGLSFRTEAGADLLFQNEDQFFGSLTIRNTGTANGQASTTSTIIANYTTNNFLKYDKTFGQHTFDLTGGTSFQKSTTNFTSIVAQQLPSDAYKAVSSGAAIVSAKAGPTDFAFLSYFARGNYKLKDRYLLSLSARIDGSSRFGANHRYGVFPAASAGWIVTEEPFMKNLTFLSQLKLRGSYGITGNAGVGNYASRGLFSAANYVGQGGQAPTQLSNPNLKWEQTAQTDIGIDFGFLGGRISFEADYYIKKTKDLLLQENIPSTQGYSTYTRNIGRLQNKGIEFVLNTENVVRGSFKWSTSLNLAMTKNKITDLDGQLLNVNDLTLNRGIKGSPIGVFYGREFAGANPINGDALYYTHATPDDKSTTNDYNAAQSVVLGNPNPKWIGGITNTVSYKGFDFSIIFQGVQGNKIYNAAGQYMSANASNGYDNQTVDQLKAWKNPGDITMVPQLRLFDSDNLNGINPSSRWLTDGSYLRLKTITLGYTIPRSFTQKWKMERIRIYATAQNLFTFTHYQGWDPEVNADFQSSNMNQGNDFYSAPQPKTITGGVNFSF